MTDQKSEKKSEMLEIRIPHPTKTAFMQKARAEGRPASEIVRDSIDAYLAGGAATEKVRRSPLTLVRKHARTLLLLVTGAVTAITMSVAISPANAQPDLRAAFAALDADGDGNVSLSEVQISPKRALATDISAAQPAPDAPVAVAAADAAGGQAYVRFMLDTGTADGVLPLLVGVQMPNDGLSGADFSRLIGSAFAGLDRNGDGMLTADEFERG